VGLFNLLKIIYTILPVKDITPNHKVSKPGLPKSEAGSEPIASSCQGWAWLGLGRAGLGGLRAAQHITNGTMQAVFLFFWCCVAYHAKLLNVVKQQCL